MLTKRIISYLRAGCLLHLITLFEMVFFSGLYFTFDIFSWLKSDFLFLKLVALSPTVCMPLFAQLDARSRYQDYKLVKDHLHVYGFQRRILKPFLKSRCQRDAAKAAASELGMSQQCEDYFKGRGYKWYHIYPDMIFTRPELLLTKNFWLTTLFAKTYHPKIDFGKIESPGRFAKKLTSADANFFYSF